MPNVIPLSDLRKEKPAVRTGCAAKSCGSAAKPADLAPGVWDKIKDHPCYSEDAHHYFARMHVAVAPGCNIRCNYCNRKFDCANESRPGVTSERLTPEQAARKALAVAEKVPQLSVIGVAGPGDALFEAKRTFETFDLIRRQLPDVKFCLSTNGLALPDHVERIAEMGIDHVTITINFIDPEIGAQIHPWVYFDNRRHTGVEGARILSQRQMEGLEALVARGVLVKVNSVMIPGINDEHLVEVNAAVTKRGAFLHNIIPMISDPSHGTVFGLGGRPGPTPAALKALQDRLEGGARLMRHCRQCRADAVGMLGEDVSQEFTLDRIEEPSPSFDPEPRRLYREVVERERTHRAAAVASATAGLAISPPHAPVRLVAVCSKAGGRINQHFGHAREFQVWEVGAGAVKFVGHRKVENYCRGGYGDDDRLDGILAALDGIEAVFVARIGRCPKSELAEAGIEAVDAYASQYIETALASWYAAKGAVSRQDTA